jgi:hypothetical protein
LVVSIVVPPPNPCTEDWQFMLHELMYLGKRKPQGRGPNAEPEVNAHDHDVQRLARLVDEMHRGVVSEADKALIIKTWGRFEHLLSERERFINPPVGHPAYRWPEGTKILPMETFMTPWVLESHQRGSFYPAELMASTNK